MQHALHSLGRHHFQSPASNKDATFDRPARQGGLMTTRIRTETLVIDSDSNGNQTRHERNQPHRAQRGESCHYYFYLIIIGAVLNHSFLHNMHWMEGNIRMGNNRAFMGKERQHFLLLFKDITGGGRDKETGTTGVCFNCVNHLSFTTDYNNRRLPWRKEKG